MASIKTPFSISPSGRVASTTRADTKIEQQIIDVLGTIEFERVMRPLYGASAMQLLFEPSDDLVYSEYKVDALQKINQHVSGAVAVDMIIEPSASPFISNVENNSVSISVIYSMRMGDLKTVSFDLVLPSELTEESAI